MLMAGAPAWLDLGTGIDYAELETLWGRLQPLATPGSSSSPQPTRSAKAGATTFGAGPLP